MEKFIQNIDTKLFIKAYNELKQLIHFKTDAEFCKRIGYGYNNLRQVITGKRNIPYKIIISTSNAYNLNLGYFTNNENTLFNNTINNIEINNITEIDLLKQRIKELENIIEIKDNQLNTLEELKNVYKSQFDTIKIEFEALKSESLKQTNQTKTLKTARGV